MRQIKTVGIVGTGVIGAGWAARFLAHGLDVVAWDPAQGAEESLRAGINNAWPALSKLGLFPGADRNRLTFAADLAAMASQVDFIQESAPENLDLKIRLHADLDQHSEKDVIIASSTSGLLPSDFQAECKNPDRVIVGHPFNPVYLLPLVEIVGGKLSDKKFLDASAVFYKSMGMHPLILKKEVEGFLADRLQEALWRENLHIINDGYASTQDMDDSISYGPGLRWAMMGSNMAYYTAGGDAGMRHFLKQFGPALKLPWTKLEAPELTDELIDKMVDGTEEQAAGSTVKELEQLRDNCLIGIMRALQVHDVGAGKILADHEAQLAAVTPAPVEWKPGMDIGKPMETWRGPVLPEWVDYNHHMTESAYLSVVGNAADNLFCFIGSNENTRAEIKKSFYTGETHLIHQCEAAEGVPLMTTTQVIASDEKRMHVFHSMYNENTGDLLCTAEQMILFVDMETGKVCPMTESMQLALKAVTAAHANMSVPEQVGRQMKVRKAGS